MKCFGIPAETLMITVDSNYDVDQTMKTHRRAVLVNFVHRKGVMDVWYGGTWGQKYVKPFFLNNETPGQISHYAVGKFANNIGK